MARDIVGCVSASFDSESFDPQKVWERTLQIVATDPFRLIEYDDEIVM